MTDPPEFFISEAVLDALDEVADVMLEPGWRDDPPAALIAAVARLDETMAEDAAAQGVKHAAMSASMETLVRELYRRGDGRRCSAARVALEVMEAGLADAAARHAPLN